MISDETYDLCRRILDDSAIDDDERTEQLEDLLRKEANLTGRPLENAVLDALWRHKNSASGTASSPPPVRHTVVRRASPAPWQIARAATPTHTPGLGAASPALARTKSSTASPFTSPRASPRLAHVALHSTPHIPHSPRLDAYMPSEPSPSGNQYGDLDGGDVDWLVNDDAGSNASSFTGEPTLNGGAAEWIGPQALDTYDLLRSVVKQDRSDDELERLLQENGYDFSATIMALMDGQEHAMPTPPVTLAEPAPTFLIGKSMSPAFRPSTPLGQQKSHILCKYYLANGSCARADCRFSHDASKVLCKYFLNGSCLAGDACIFSHDASLLMQRMTLENAATPPLYHMQMPPNFQIGDYDAFPTLQHPPTNINQFAASGYDWDAFEKHNGSIGAVAPPPGFNPLISHIPNGPSRPHSRPSSRHTSRAPTPSVPAVDDAEAFPTLGSAASAKGAKKHHGKRGGHGHAHNKETPPSTLADLVRMSPSPSPSLRKNLQKPVGGGLRAPSSSGASIPPPEHIPWLETGEGANKAYLKARAEAIKHGGLRNKFLQSAAQAYNRNDSRAAKALSLRGQSENNAMREAHREAARALYEERNKHRGGGGGEVYVDLHGLHPEEAVTYLHKALREHESRSHLSPNSNQVIYAITGTGHHSRNGKDKIGKAIRTFLMEWRYNFREFSVPGDRNSMGGIIGVDAGSWDRSVKLGEISGGGSGEGEAGEKGSTKVRILRKEDMDAEAEAARAKLAEDGDS